MSGQRISPLRVCSLSFLAWRFSLSVLPDFLEAVLRGDLSVMSTPFPVCSVLPCRSHRLLPERRPVGGRPSGRNRVPDRGGAGATGTGVRCTQGRGLT